MILDIIKIGNSKGLRLPKGILKECQITDKVNLHISNNKIIIEPSSIRSNWEEQFKKEPKIESIEFITNE